MRSTSLIIVAGALFLAMAAGTALAETIRCPTAGQGVCDGTNNPDVLNGVGGVNGRDLMSGSGNDKIDVSADSSSDRVDCDGGFDRATAGSNDVVSSNCERIRRT